MKKKIKFYLFNQNNSGGDFVTDDKLCHRLCIEASSEEEAIEKAENMGVYFDGVEKGMDCPCCGDRWYEPDERTFPMKYYEGLTFKDVSAYAQYLADHYGWTKPDGRIFYLSGKVEEIFIREKKV